MSGSVTNEKRPLPAWLPSLWGGACLLMSVDPDGILGDFRVSALRHSVPDSKGAGTFWASLFSIAGEQVNIYGPYEGGTVFIDRIFRAAGPGHPYDVRFPCVPSLSYAIEDNPGLGACLSLTEGVNLRRNPDPVPMYPYSVFMSEERGVFSGMEGGGTDDGYVDRFNEVFCNYSYDGSIPVKANVEFLSSVNGGNVYARAVVENIGISRRKVLLEKTLGLGRYARVECYADGGRPSLVVAFDLADAIGDLYCAQRRDKMSRGKPRAQSDYLTYSPR